MSPALAGGVELLERSLAYTGGVLGELDRTGGDLTRSTPCDRWDLGALLAHMDDGLDAFTEAAAGIVRVDRAVADRAAADGAIADVLRAKACALLAAWLDAPAERVEIGDAALQAPVLTATAALEITVHGWDVARSVGADRPVPAHLAAGLLGVAHGVLRPADRIGRFAKPLSTPGRAAPDELLLAHLGRVPPAPHGQPGSFRFWERRGTRAAF